MSPKEKKAPKPKLSNIEIYFNKYIDKLKQLKDQGINPTERFDSQMRLMAEQMSLIGRGVASLELYPLAGQTLFSDPKETKSEQGSVKEKKAEISWKKAQQKRNASKEDPNFDPEKALVQENCFLRRL